MTGILNILPVLAILALGSASVHAVEAESLHGTSAACSQKFGQNTVTDVDQQRLVETSAGAPQRALLAVPHPGTVEDIVETPAPIPRAPVHAEIVVPPSNAMVRPAAGVKTASSSIRSYLPPSWPADGEADLIQTPVEKPVLTAQSAPKYAQVQSIADQTDMKPSDPPSKAGKMLKPDAWGQVLAKYATTDDGGLVRFDYGALKASAHDMNMLNAYLDDMAGKQPSTFTSEQAMVYWANLYNALTVKVVAENYPVSSIRKIKSGWRAGPWRRKLITVEGEELTLDNIEHDIMRPTFNSPLVHYMVNCASVGCPNLKRTPWQVASLDSDLRSAAQDFINSPRGVQIDKGRLKVSSIYHWYSEDFGDSHTTVIAHLAEYADDDLAAKLIGRKKIDKFDYDWGINAP